MEICVVLNLNVFFLIELDDCGKVFFCFLFLLNWFLYIEILEYI